MGRTRVNIAECILGVTAKYEIEPQLSCFVMDNAGNNGTTMDAIEKTVPGIGRNCPLKCVSHTLNLIIKANLYGEGILDFNSDISGSSDTEAFAIWRRFRGALSKVRNSVKYIMRSYQRRQAFIALQTEVKDEDPIFKDVERLLVKDGAVRWNSTFSILLRAPKLREAIGLFQLRHKPTRGGRKGAYSTIEDRILRMIVTRLGSTLSSYVRLSRQQISSMEMVKWMSLRRRGDHCGKCFYGFRYCTFSLTMPCAGLAEMRTLIMRIPPNTERRNSTSTLGCLWTRHHTTTLLLSCIPPTRWLS